MQASAFPRRTALAAGTALLLGGRGAGRAAAQPGGAIESQRARFRVERLPGRLQHPWSVAFLPDGTALVTERPGRLRRVRLPGGLVDQPVAGVPAVDAVGQGGLLDIALHPAFATNGLVYLSHAARTERGNASRVVRARFDGAALARVETVLEAAERPGGGRLHFGCRLAFARDGTLYVTVGERNQRQRAQDRADPAGKVLRINDDGTIPPDNPFVGRADAHPAVFSYGHRNPQGLALHPGTGAVWEHEHGARGGDEVNILRAGANYGWPITTHGVDYSGAPIGIGPTAPGITDPIHVWVPSIAPSGMAFYTAEAFPGWRGGLFVGGLAGQCLARLTLEGDRVVAEERLLTRAIGRIRDVRQGPDGFLYLLTDEEDGGLYRLLPA